LKIGCTLALEKCHAETILALRTLALGSQREIRNSIRSVLWDRGPLCQIANQDLTDLQRSLKRARLIEIKLNLSQTIEKRDFVSNADTARLTFALPPSAARL
jgi:hypothetical protein